MNWLAENALTICMVGVVALAMALFVFFQTRTRVALFGIAGLFLVFGLLVLVSWLIETPREAVERALYDLASTVEVNDVKGALSFITSSANGDIRKDIENLMPLVKIERARVIGTPEVEIEGHGNNLSATVKCQGLIIAVDKRNGIKGGANDRLVMKWVLSDGRWLVESYASQKNWNRALGR